jgi:hypothetical protein
MLCRKGRSRRAQLFSTISDAYGLCGSSFLLYHFRPVGALILTKPRVELLCVYITRDGTAIGLCVSALYNTKISPKETGGRGDDSFILVIRIPRFSLVARGLGTWLPQNDRLAEPDRIQENAHLHHAKDRSDYPDYQTAVSRAERLLQTKSWTLLDWAESVVTEPCKGAVSAVLTLTAIPVLPRFVSDVRATAIY